MSIREVCKELQEVAAKELNEEPGRIQNDIAYIKEWLKKQPHLNCRTDEQFLIAFLRGTKFSLERTKEKLDMHYTLKTVAPEFYTNRDPFAPEIQKILSLGILLPLPKLPHPGAPRYMLMRNGVAEQHNINQLDICKVNAMLEDIALIEDDNTTIAGIVAVQDMSNVTLNLIKSMPFSLMKKATTCFQQGYPFRIKGGYFFNITGVFDVIYSMFKPLLTEKLKKRMSVYKNLDELSTAMPTEILPEEYGGQGGKIPDIAADWKAKVESYAKWYKEDEKYRTDETKRIGTPKTSESVFGLEGSFRQLAVD